MYSNDQRTVVTLDAGGTTLSFSAIRGNEIIEGPVVKEANASDLDLCIATLKSGFAEIINKLDNEPVAISFAFPGPADYPNGVIGGFLPNFPSFRDGVALAAILEKEFKVPVFINNDADLFVYGEALAGALPEVNEKLKMWGSAKKYRNLIGFTWGTGFGFGFTVNGNMHIGDNSCSEVYCLPYIRNKKVIVEEGVSIRAIRRVYGKLTNDQNHDLQPVDIFNIAEGTMKGNQKAAKAAFAEFGRVAGDVIANVVTLIDGLIVIGGGITKAHKYIMPALMKVLQSEMKTLSGETLNRLQFKVYNLDNERQFKNFAKGESRKIKVYGHDDEVTYDPLKRVGITISKLGASNAVALGAYAFALNEIDNQKR